MIKVFICEDIEKVLAFFKSAVESAGDMEVVGTANSGKDAVDMILQTSPDIVLMDIQMETKHAGIEAVKKIYSARPDIKIIMLTVYNDDDLIFKSYLAGAVDYINKLEKPEYVLEEIRKIHREEVFIGPTIANNIRGNASKIEKMQNSLLYVINKWSMLTQTEIDIIKSLIQGKTRREIAIEKGVEKETIKKHVNNILKKVEYPSTNKFIDELRKIGVIEFLFGDKN